MRGRQHDHGRRPSQDRRRVTGIHQKRPKMGLLSALANLHKVNIVVFKQRFRRREAEMNVSGRWHREFVTAAEQRKAVPMLLREDQFLALKLREGKNNGRQSGVKMHHTMARQIKWQECGVVKQSGIHTKRRHPGQSHRKQGRQVFIVTTQKASTCKAASTCKSSIHAEGLDTQDKQKRENQERNLAESRSRVNCHRRSTR